MEDECTEWENEMERNTRYLKTIADVYYWLYEGWAVYDDPWDAMEYCSVTSSKYRGGDWWEQWKHDHYVGHENVEERALKDPYVCSYLKRFGLLPDDKTAEPLSPIKNELENSQVLK